jgi:predicted helicase
MAGTLDKTVAIGNTGRGRLESAAMSRMPTQRATLERLAKDLARDVREGGGGMSDALAVFRRFLEEDSGLVDSLPHDAVRAEGRLWELLQRELDADRRRRRGMFFTPRPLVECIVRSVAAALAREHARSPVHVIDPACGYGGFLIEAARQVGASRLTGIELDEATAAVARLLTAREGSNAAPDIITANPLLAGDCLRNAILGPASESWLPVIVGNPPWSNFGRQNRGAWIDRLLADYRDGLAERKSNLADDAIKFIRWAQYWVEQAEIGIMAFVTPNTWLTGLTHRQMRASLLRAFDELWILDLHGEPGDVGDENVFGVRSGVAVVLAVRGKSAEHRDASAARVRLVSLRGTRAEKLAALDGQTLQALARLDLMPTAPDWLIAQPRQRAAPRGREAGDYASYWPLDRIFRQYTSGVQTKNDAIFVAFTHGELAAQVQAWLAEQRDALPFDDALFQPYLLAPFDRRFVYYDPRVIGRARHAVMRHMLRSNLGLVFMRQSTNSGEYDHFLAVDCLVSDRVFYSRHGAPFLAPLWLEDEDRRSEVGSRRSEGGGRRTEGARRPVGNALGGVPSGPDAKRPANFSDEFIAAVAAAIGQSPDPLGVFHYLYAVAHWPAYRATFAAELRRGFPRFPLPVDGPQYERLSALGGRLMELHVGAQTSGHPGAGLLPAMGSEQGLEIPFRLGGYDVLKRWARPRRARGLAADDQHELARLAWIGRETRRIMQEIDQVAGDVR